jgi:ribonuclease D
MKTITTTDDLAAFCAAAKAKPYVTVDTEFLRERTYWSKLCLIQMALPGKTGEAVLVDPIEGRRHVDGAALRPVPPRGDGQGVPRRAAGSGDLLVEAGVFPTPLFDTQVAAMVCGFGEQVAYETLVRKIAKSRSTRPRASPTGRAAR